MSASTNIQDKIRSDQIMEWKHEFYYRDFKSSKEIHCFRGYDTTWDPIITFRIPFEGSISQQYRYKTASSIVRNMSELSRLALLYLIRRSEKRISNHKINEDSDNRLTLL